MNLKYGPYSPSRLDTAVCGYAFHKQYIDPERKKYARVEGIPQARGSAVHEVLEIITKRYLTNLNTNPRFTDEELRAWVAEAVNRHPAAYAEVNEILDMARRYAAKPPKVLTADAETELRLAIKQVGTEWETCHYDDPEAIARGRADIMLVSDDLTTGLFYDHKTQPNVEEADTFQMGFYAWVISKIHPFLETIQTVLHFARYGIYSEPYSWSKQQLEQVEDEILTRIGIIEARTSWEATPNKNCQYCPLIAECPVMGRFVIKDERSGMSYIDKAGFQILGDTNKAVQVAGLLTVLEEAVKLCKSELRAHVKGLEYGIAIPGKVYEFRTEESIDWGKVNKMLKEDVKAVFAKHGIAPDAYMGFSQTFTNDVWLLGNKDLLDDLAAILPRKKSSEFSGYKV